MEQTAWTLAEKYGQGDFASTFPVIARSDGYFIYLISEKDQEQLLAYDNEGNIMTGDDPVIDEGELFDHLDNSGGYLLYYVDDKPHNSQWAVWSVVIANLDGFRQVLVVSKSMADVDQLLRMLASRGALVVGAVMIIAMILAVVIAKIYVRPIGALNRNALELARGNLEVSFDSGGPLEIVQLSESLTKARDEFQATESLRRDFIANISHDMKTPLTVIKAYAEMLESYSAEIPEKREEHLKIIMNETDKLTALINDTMELARLQSGTMEPQRECFNLTDEVRKVMDSFAVRPDLSEFVFEVSGCEKVLVFADRHMISRVLENLVGNGIKFCDREKYVGIHISCSDSWVYTKVTDHGIGIEADKLDIIWDRFYQVLPYSKDKAGMGMGLNIVHQILKLHDAKFGVESTPGQGTTFWFALKEADNETQDH